MAATDAPQQAIGGTVTSYGGSIGYGGAWDVAAEHIPALAWPESVATYQRMRTDPVCASILAAYIGPLIAADWRINPSGADPAIVAICADSLGLPLAGEKVDNIGALRRRGVKWIEFVRLACLHLVWGHIGFEPVYEIRDGKAYLKALPERMPSTVVDIKINDDGTLKSIVQAGTGKGSTPTGVEIPADRLLWFCHNREGSNYTGTSLLRSCYSDWLLKLDSKRANAIGINRFGAGTPVAEPLPGTNPTTAQIAEAQRMVSAIRVGETGGAVPAGFKLRIIGVEGSLPDIVPTIQMHNQEMARGSLTSVLDLGNTSNGSRALGDTFSDMLKGAIQAVGDAMAEVATQLCERLTTFNAGEGANSPQVSCGDVGASKAAIVTAITGLVAAGIVTADEGLESYARDGYHLPSKDETPAQSAPTPNETGSKLGVAPPAGDGTLAASGWQPWVRAAGGADAHTGSEAKLVEWYVHGEGAARIRWGTAGDFDRCRAIAGKYMPPGETAGFCANRHKEATGQWPGKGRVHAAEGDPQPYREPTAQEQAAGLDPAQVDEAQDGLVAEGMALFAAIVAVWGAAIAAQITASLAVGSLAGLARLTVDSTDAALGLAVLMREAADAGVDHALDEAGRAGIPAPSVAPEVDGDALDDAAEAAADLMGQGLASAAGREAARIAGPDSDPKTVARTAVATVTESDTPIHDAIAAGITRAMGAGRAAAQAVLMLGADLVPFASAIRDTNSCEPCLENDGYEYEDLADALADFPTGHYSECLGRSRCRCLIALRPAGIVAGRVMAGRHSFNEGDHPRNHSGPQAGQFTKAPTGGFPSRRTGGSRVRVDPTPAKPSTAPSGRHKAPVPVKAPEPVEPAVKAPAKKTAVKKAPAVKAPAAKKAPAVKKAPAAKKTTPAKAVAPKKTATKTVPKAKKTGESNDTIALKYYQYDGAQHINTALRRGKVGDQKEMVAHMDKMLAATSTSNDMKVYRVASGSHFGDFKPGTTITDQAFLSTSNDRDAALAHMFRIEDDDPVIFEIDLPKGSQAIDMNSHLPDSAFKGEKEFILPRGMKLRVVSSERTPLTGKFGKSKKTKPGRVVRMEIVPEVSGG